MATSRERNIPKTCAVCGSSFMAAHPAALYCSDRCKQKSFREGPTSSRTHRPKYECSCCYCGKHFMSQQKTTRFCSNRCRYQADKEQRHIQNMHTEVWDVDPGFIRPPKAIGIQDLADAATELRQLDVLFAAAVFVSPPDCREICEDVHQLLTAALRRLGQ